MVFASGISSAKSNNFYSVCNLMTPYKKKKIFHIKGPNTGLFFTTLCYSPKASSNFSRLFDFAGKTLCSGSSSLYTRSFLSASSCNCRLSDAKLGNLSPVSIATKKLSYSLGRLVQEIIVKSSSWMQLCASYLEVYELFAVLPMPPAMVLQFLITSNSEGFTLRKIVARAF